MKNVFSYSLIILSCLLFASTSNGQNNFFTDAKESNFTTANQNRVIIPQKYRTLSLDTLALSNFLSAIPSAKNLQSRNDAPVISIPLPNGKTGLFHIWETSIMEPALAAKFPGIKTFTGQGIDDRTATIKIDWTELGFHAMILSPINGHVFIDPYAQGNTTNYISYFKSDFKASQRFIEQDIPGKINTSAARPADISLASACVGSQLLTYRLVVACTHQYAIAATGFATPTVNQTLAAIVKTVQRVNGIYETELSISLVLVANDTAVIFNNTATDPLSADNSNPNTLIPNGQNVIDTKIGNANYDLGIIFSTGAGGATYIGEVCQPGYKAHSAVGVTNPVGDPFNVDYVAHEIGHLFGAHHPFNSALGYCGDVGGSPQEYPGSNDEPGSGSTIMGYAGDNAVNGILCGSDNLQLSSDPQFNGINFSEIINFATSQGNCAAVTSTTNHPPVVNAGANYTIPVSTPFFLTGSATDQDGDPLTYSWEQVDVGGVYCAWNAPVDASYGNAPLFRSFPPVVSPTRYFPKLSDVINNTTTIGEIMPKYTRTMHFRLTARDNVAANGGVCYAENAVAVDGNSGPFIVTYPDAANIKFKVGDVPIVTWNNANTQAAPVSCANVAIQLSTDGGLTFPVTLLASTPNTGSAQIQVPNNITTTGRIRVVAVGNIFYDISNNNFTIQDSTVPITWLSFTATKQINNTALLTWKVNEHNTNHYEIERSIDGVTFKKIASVLSGTGNTANTQYTYTDAAPFMGTDYYRIKEIFADGSSDFSITTSLNFDKIPTPWTVFPNPATGGNVNVLSNGNATSVAMQLYDAAGKLMYENTLAQSTVGQVITIASSRFAKGIYTLKINSSLGTSNQKILIE